MNSMRLRAAAASVLAVFALALPAAGQGKAAKSQTNPVGNIYEVFKMRLALFDVDGALISTKGAGRLCNCCSQCQIQH